MIRPLLAPRLALLLCAIVAGAAAALSPVNGIASASSPAATAANDGEFVIVYMNDGRELAGRIVREDAAQIVIRYVDPTVRIETTLTLMKRDIAHIERNVETDDAGDEPIMDEGDPYSPERLAEMPETERVRGLSEGDAADESLPSIYVIPMKGQMGTDIHPDVYKRVADDIRERRPDVVVWVMNCADVDELLISLSDEREEGLIFMLDEYRDMVRTLRDQLRGVRQVMWVEDSVGMSSVVALAWEEVYMTPGARLGGLRKIWAMAAGWQDTDVRAKMVAAWIGIANGFLEKGGRPIELGRAMMQPSYELSATWRGREVIWTLDTSGEYIVDNSPRHTSEFRAKTAEDFGISAGTAETLDDLALLLGYREYRVIDGRANQMVERYVTDWRRAFENTQKWYRDFDQFMGWATGRDEMQYLGRARSAIRSIIAAMERFPAVETRWRADYGWSKFHFVTIDEMLNERIRALRNRGGRGGGGGGGGRAPGGGLGGPR